MSTVKHVVIAAAGLGSRLGYGKPKCLVEVGGRPIIAHQLALLDQVEDVRIVIGYEEQDVIETALKFRRDVTFVRNPAFRTTTTAVSYALGAKGLREPALYMDGDIVFEHASFQNFMQACGDQCPLIGVTDAKTVDAVFAQLDDQGWVKGFSREVQAPHEWANLIYVPPAYFEAANGAVFEFLENELPIPAQTVVSFEVDREDDLERAQTFVASLSNQA